MDVNFATSGSDANTQTTAEALQCIQFAWKTHASVRQTAAEASQIALETTQTAAEASQFKAAGNRPERFPLYRGMGWSDAGDRIW